MRNNYVVIALFTIGTLLSCAKVSQDSTGANEIPGYNNHAAPGASSQDLLTDATFKKLTVEIQFVGGYAPTTDSQNAIKSFVEARLNKTGGVTIVDDTVNILPPAKTTYSLDDIVALEKTYRQSYTSVNDGSLVVYYMFVDGAFEGDVSGTSTLGVAYQNTSLVIFEKTIRSLAGGLTQPPLATVETTVMEHELGHLMGLVNNGTPLQSAHEDASHQAHCSVTTCLMYYNVDTSNVIANLLGGTVPALDPDCVADLQAAGGK